MSIDGLLSIIIFGGIYFVINLIMALMVLVDDEYNDARTVVAIVIFGVPIAIVAFIMFVIEDITRK